LSRATRSEVEEVANLAVRRDLPVRALLMSLADARAFGALALFGETYDESAVRVVEVGGPWSRELCGGTHVAHSSQIGPLVLTGESSVGSGVRRVEALVGIEGFRGLVRDRELVAGLSELLKTPSDGLADRVAGLVARIRDLEREAAAQQARAAANVAGELAQSPRDVFGVAFVGHRAPDGTPGDVLRTLALDVRGRLGDGPAVVALAAAIDGRVQLVVAANQVAQQWRISAGDLVKVGAPVVGGNGGGKPDVAQGGGTDPSRIEEALTAIEHAVGARATGSA
jgi:alanyl-tRNA synthetase